MPEIVTDILVDASADRVWRTLADLPAYPQWNPLFRRVSGELALHQSLSVVRIRADGGETTEHPTIVLYRPGRELRWRSRMLLPFILDIEHSFKIEPLGPDSYIEVAFGPNSMTVRMEPDRTPALGETVTVQLPAAKLHFFDTASGSRIN